MNNHPALPRMIQPAFALLLAAAVAVVSDARAVELQLLDGTTVAGRVTAWDSQGVTVDGAAGSRTVANDAILGMNSPPTVIDLAAQTTMIELVDGSRFPIEGFTCNDRVAEVRSRTGDLSISTDTIVRVVLQPPTDAATAMWGKLEVSEPTGDALLVLKREGAVDYLTGVVGDVTEDEVTFDWDGQKVPIKRTKVAGIAFYHANEQRLPAAVCELSLFGGAKIPVRKISLDGDMLRVETPVGVKLDVKLEVLEHADFSAGKLVYLSNLKPENVRWTPRVALPGAAALIASYGAPRNDASYSGSALTLAWPDDSLAAGREVRTYAKGLALRSRTEATYRLPPGMKRFTATAGIDPATTDQGHVVLEIRADNRVLWQGEIDGQQPPVELDLKLGAARRLQFVIDYGRNLDYGDRLHLVDARVTQ